MEQQARVIRLNDVPLWVQRTSDSRKEVRIELLLFTQRDTARKESVGSICTWFAWKPLWDVIKQSALVLTVPPVLYHKVFRWTDHEWHFLLFICVLCKCGMSYKISSEEGFSWTEHPRHHLCCHPRDVKLQLHINMVIIILALQRSTLLAVGVQVCCNA